VLERFAFDNICRVAFGEDPACLAEEGMAAPRSAEFMRAFNDAQSAVTARFMSPFKSLWRLKRLLGMEPERRMREALRTIHGYADRIILERRRAGVQGRRLPVALQRERRAQRREPPGRGHQPPPRGARHDVVGADLVLLAGVHPARRGG
jgi:hypothetical protein